MRIAIDCDGVVSNFTSALVKLVVNKIWPGKLSPNFEPADWGYSEIFTKEQWDRIWEEIRGTTNFWLQEEPYIENIRAVQEYWDTHPETDIFFVTSRIETAGETVAAQTSQWLQQHWLYPRWGHSQVIPVTNAREKANVMKSLGVEYSLDDLPETVHACNQIAGHRAYLLARKWNEGSMVMMRVESVKEYLEIVAGTAVKCEEVGWGV